MVKLGKCNECQVVQKRVQVPNEWLGQNQAKILSELFKTESQPNAYIHISIRCVFLRIVFGRKHYCVLISPLNDM